MGSVSHEEAGLASLFSRSEIALTWKNVVILPLHVPVLSERELILICGLTQEGFVGSSAVQLLEGSFIYCCSSLAADGKLPDFTAGETCCKFMWFVIKSTSARNAQHAKAASAHKQNVEVME